jgi:hypothetical protein
MSEPAVSQPAPPTACPFARYGPFVDAGVYGALVVLTLGAAGASIVPLWSLNLQVSLGLAGLTALLMVASYMRPWTGRGMHAAILLGSLLSLGILLAYTLSDTTHRAELDKDQGAKVLPSTGAPAPGGTE